ncbi:MAG: transcriptional repressor LexA [Candidatus Obscuribacterales bacterium]|nr:transcriptional repressor LexA [Candidatus Obscuribacterales bacterium]
MVDATTELSLDSLPTRQKDVLKQIMILTKKCGYPPTLAELATSLGLKNRMTIHQHVAALKKKGFVHWEPGLNRSLRVLESLAVEVPEEAPPTGLPFVGTIAAGRPIDALETAEYLEIDQRYANDGCFALKVKGDSMIEDGIYDGDFVIVKPNPSPRNGEVVVALLEDGNATLKRFFKEAGRYRLQPANSALEPIYVPSTSPLEIQGSVVALFRKLN